MLMSMPSRKGMTSMDATIDDRSTRLGKAFAPRLARLVQWMGLRNFNGASRKGSDPICAIVAGLV